ncbi:AI-2E family transporter [Cryptosporangium sp. NPDC048952]|uniref:AI-2E family transporter n=1 Tax=Cryptosporangium sp. NPDC048952 TaxID=3363961 RepID=UPI00371C480C
MLSSSKTRAALSNSARISMQVLLLLLMTTVALWILGKAWSILWPLVVALLITTLTWPPTRFLRKHHWHPALAATTVTLGFLLVAVGTIVGIVLPVAAQSGELADGIVDGVGRLRDWASGPPLNISDDQISKALDTVTSRVQDSAGSIASGALTGVSVITNGLITVVLALFLMFFFLKDGPKFLPWMQRQLPGRLATDIPTVAARSWLTLGSFVRSQAAVGLLDAICIGIGLWIVGVPLVLPLAVLTFVAAFIPIVGAVFAGFVAVVIALVFNGLTDALIVLAIILLVQQLEGNIFQPMLQSRGLGLHAAIVLLAVTLGGSLFGIVGSLLAVPVAAIIAVIWNYIREQLSDPDPDAEPNAEPESTDPPPAPASADEATTAAGAGPITGPAGGATPGAAPA